MIVCISASHKTVGLPMLEALTFNEEKFTNTLRENELLQEFVLIQTCNRVEISYSSSEGNQTNCVNRILRLWSTITGVSIDILEKAIRIYYGKEALQHLFFLASGLDSVVLGEDQILGQIRTAWLKAKKNGTTKIILDKSFMKAINIGKRVRNETRINERAISVSSVAVDLAAKELADLKSRKVLIIGAGEAGSLAAQAFRSKSSSSIFIANRTYEKSLVLAHKISGSVVPFTDIPTIIPELDLIIVAVSVSQPLFKEEQFYTLNGNNGSKRLLVIDISQPHAVEKTTGIQNGVTLKTIDDLKEVITQNLRNREVEAEKCKMIISEELERFEKELSKLFVQPLITEIYRKYELIRKKELARAVHKMGEFDKKKLIVLDRFSRELTERIVQIPVEQLRAAALNNDGEVLSVAKKIFKTETSSSFNQLSEYSKNQKKN
jgi:glutamyl-tRNA reductase